MVTKPFNAGVAGRSSQKQHTFQYLLVLMQIRGLKSYQNYLYNFCITQFHLPFPESTAKVICTSQNQQHSVHLIP